MSLGATYEKQLPSQIGSGMEGGGWVLGTECHGKCPQARHLISAWHQELQNHALF